MTGTMTRHLCKGRVVAITGGGRGIGRDEAIELARQGAHVVVNNRSPEPAQEVVEMIRAEGGSAVAHVGDVSDMAVATDMSGHLIDPAKRNVDGFDPYAAEMGPTVADLVSRARGNVDVTGREEA